MRKQLRYVKLELNNFEGENGIRQLIDALLLSEK